MTHWRTPRVTDGPALRGLTEQPGRLHSRARNTRSADGINLPVRQILPSWAGKSTHEGFSFGITNAFRNKVTACFATLFLVSVVAFVGMFVRILWWAS